MALGTHWKHMIAVSQKWKHKIAVSWVRWTEALKCFITDSPNHVGLSLSCYLDYHQKKAEADQVSAQASW
jgi:hypothetical protein